MSAMRQFARPSRVRLLALVATPLIFLSVLFPIKTSALTFKSAPARLWGNVVASDIAAKEKVSGNKSANLEGEKKSEWRITFSGFPNDAKEAVQYAIDVWSLNFESKVPINVEATWETNRDIEILGSARPGFFFSDFAGAPDKGLWYPSALANALAGRDLDSNQAEIVLKVNSAPLWHLETTGSPPPGSYDLVSVVIHEIAHGLGFVSNATYDRSFGTGYISQPTPYDAYVQLPDGRTLIDFCSRSTELGEALVGPLVWSGRNGISANKGVAPKLYTPNPYEDGSSITHLDEGIFSNDSADLMMTPKFGAGEVRRTLGPIVLGMLQDMKNTPTKSTATNSPISPMTFFALAGDNYALIDEEPSSCGYLKRNITYEISILPGDRKIFSSKFPTKIGNLKNGNRYRFEVRSRNMSGAVQTILTNYVTPRKPIGSISTIPIGPTISFTATKFNNRQVIIFSELDSDTLKLATFSGRKWRIEVVRKNIKVGQVSTCTARKGSEETLFVVYADKSRGDLLVSTLTNQKWLHETIDGNGEQIQDIDQTNRNRTSSDVSVSNACASTAKGLQVFYRDDTLGVLLGATKTSAGWAYELIDGDQLNKGRTTGDVAFQLSATEINGEVFLIYDSILSVNSRGVPIQGEVRLARRKTVFPEDWNYKTLDGPSSGVSVAGFATAIYADENSGFASWLQSNSQSPTKPTKVAYINLVSQARIESFSAESFGSIDKPLLISDRGVAFSCLKRLCYKNFANKKTDFLISQMNTNLTATQYISTRQIFATVNKSNRLVSIRL